MHNIMLFCAAGMSTSMLVERMKAAAADQGYEVEIAAHAVSEAAKLGGDADFILLGPHDAKDSPHETGNSLSPEDPISYARGYHALLLPMVLS